MRKILSLSIALSLFGLAFPLAASASPAARVKPAAVAKLAESTKMYTIVAKEIESTPPGCYQCKPQKKDVPSFSPVASSAKYDSILTATKIDNFSQTTTDMSGCTGGPCNPVSETVDGACAIVLTGLSCFGANQFGQLGNEPANPATVTTPTPATNGGVALTGITDVAANGETTCIVQSAALKCVGKGNWPGLHFRTGSTSYYINTQTWSAATNSYANSGNSANDNSYLSETLDETNTVLSSVIGTGYQGANGLFSKTWRTLITTGVKSIQIGAANGSTPAICALMVAGTVQCANVTNGAAGTNTSSNVQRYDCSNPVDGEYESEVYCQSIQGWVNRTFRSRSENRNSSETTAATWAWVNAKGTPDATTGVATDIVGATDMSMSAANWGAGQVCIAASAVTCRSFSGAKFGATGAAIEGSEGATRVYMTNNWGNPGLCIHNQGTLSCGAGSNGPNGVATMPTALTAVGVMAEPLSIFMDQSITSMQKIYFVLPSGLLSADQWIFSCKQCYSNESNVVAPVSAFADSTATAFNYTTGIAGATDSIKLIPLKVSSGVRTARSGALLTFKTSAGDLLAGATFKWATPDYPVLASSAKATNLVTDVAGTVRASIAGGPVTFTVTGGTSASGATLQASTVTTLIPDSGNAEITVAAPSTFITRVVKVVMANGNPVPNATIKLKNNYLSYDYANSANGTSSWATEAAGADFGLATCSQCFVAPPVYITGDDGTVSFKSFSPKSRSSKYDALIEYDDGDLNKSIEVNFKTASDSVEMPFMPGLDVTIVDSDKTTPTVDLTANASGTVTIPLELKDESGAAYSGFTATATEVCDAADTGGLFSATATVTDVCSTSSSTKTKSAGARSGVRALAACTAGKATTDAKGKGVIKVCTTTSKKYRIAGVGALPSRTFCIKVKGVKCSEPVSAASLKIQNTVLAKNAVFPKGTFAGQNNQRVYYDFYKFTKALSRKSSISLTKLASLTENYERGDILLESNPGCTGCGTLGVTTSLTPTICKVQGSYVTALNKKGICQIGTSVQYGKKINKNDRRKVFIQVS